MDSPISSLSSKRQSILIGLIVTIFFVLGAFLASLSPLGNAIRGWIYGGRGTIDLATTQEIYRILYRDFDGKLDRNALQDGASDGLVTATGDRFSSYLTPSAWMAFRQRMSGSLIGIGVELGVKNYQLLIISPRDGSPAKEAGLRAGDIILEIDGRPVVDMSEQEAVEALRGANGTSVQLVVMRGDERLRYTIQRRPIDIPSVRAIVTNDNVGVITIASFDDNTARLSTAVANGFRTKAVRGVVVDMRGNPGGSVVAARDVAGLWLPKNSLVMTEKRAGVTLRTYRTEGVSVLGGVPTIVLLDGGSASASEVVAGALRDHGFAKIYGAQSFGKGSVQQVRQLGNGGALSFTVSRWFTPKGTNIDGVGVSPDRTIGVSGDGSEDSQLNAALQSLSASRQ